MLRATSVSKAIFRQLFAMTNSAFPFSWEQQRKAGFTVNSQLYNALGGVQFKDNASTARLKPFGYALAGAGIGRVKVKDVSCPVGVDCSDFTSDSETGFAMAFGGGLDIKINDRIDFRAIKADYNPIRFDSGTQHNFRVGIGFVFK